MKYLTGCQPVSAAQSKARFFNRSLAMLCLFTVATGLLSGCAARMKQYSIDSWQGPLPLRDQRYIEDDTM